MRVPHLGLRNTDIFVRGSGHSQTQGLSFTKNVPTKHRVQQKQLGKTAVNVPKSPEGKAARQDLLRSKGSTPYARLSLEIDLTDVINSMEFMESVRQLFDDKKLHDMTVEYAHAVYAREIYRSSRGIEDRMAHVYYWESVIDVTSHTRSKGKKKSKSRAMDQHARFIPKIDRNAPLWRLLPPTKSGNSFIARIGFLQNSEPAMYDSRVYGSINAMQGPRRWGEHHFKDQAAQLEKVLTIQKRTSKVSPRRLNARSNPQAKAQIVQLAESESGLSLINFVNYSRPNNFYRKFAEFFMAFGSQGVEGAQAAFPALEKELEKITDQEMKKELLTASRQAQYGLQGASMSFGKGISIRPGATTGGGGSKVEITITANGRRINNVVAPKGKYRDKLAEATYKEIVSRTSDAYAEAHKIMYDSSEDSEGVAPKKKTKATKRRNLGKSGSRSGKASTWRGAVTPI